MKMKVIWIKGLKNSRIELFIRPFQKFNKINDNYILLKSLDHFGDDIDYIPNKSIDEMIEICNKNENIICFNTLGYFKNICKLETLINFNDDNKGLIININRFNLKYGNIT